MKNKLLLFISFVCSFSCEHNLNENSSDYVIINVGESLKTKSLTKLNLNDLANEVKIIPVQTTDSTLLNHLFIGGIVGDTVITFQHEKLSFIHKETGEITTILNDPGPGPEEYQFIIDVIVQDDSILRIYDTTKKGFLAYNFNGKFLSFFKNDTIINYQKLSDGNFCVCYPSSGSANFTGIYDDKWNLLREGVKNNRKDISFDMYYWSKISKYNHECYFKDIFCDTIFQITSTQDIPYIILSKGVYKAPMEIAASLERTYKEGHNYLFQEDYDIASKYLFFSYNFNNTRFYDIWDIQTSKLLYRGTENQDGSSGIPITINDVEVRVWVDYAKGNTIYCVVPPFEAIKLIPTLPADTNPIILEIKLKE